MEVPRVYPGAKAEDSGGLCEEKREVRALTCTSMQTLEGTLCPLIVSRLVGERARDSGTQVPEKRQGIGRVAKNEAMRPGGELPSQVCMLHDCKGTKISPFLVGVAERE